jgi:hypothetical protein
VRELACPDVHAGAELLQEVQLDVLQADTAERTSAFEGGGCPLRAIIETFVRQSAGSRVHLGNRSLIDFAAPPHERSVRKLTKFRSSWRRADRFDPSLSFDR